MAERMIETNGVELCTETFGDRAQPPILLIMGMGASMGWWNDEFCRMLADGGRFVIRYDHRDTGRSVSYEPGRPGYGSADLTRDAVGVLDVYRIAAAHLVGFSMGGGIAQSLVLEVPERVQSLVLMSTSPAVGADRGLPPSSDAYVEFLASAEVDWWDGQAVVDYLVAHWRALTGADRRFDEASVRACAQREVGRARNVASAQNHDLIVADGVRSPRSLGSIGAPTLVIHGSADPLFPLEHGIALAKEIPAARLVTLEGAGHELNRADWETIAQAILEHTAAAAREEPEHP